MKKNFKLLVLAAGRGSRLKNKTSKIPKYLTKINGKRILNWQFKIFNELNIDQKDILIISGYKSNKINFKNKIINKNWRKSNMLYSLLLASKILKKNNCIVTYGDIIYKKKVLKKLIKSKKNVSIIYDTLWKNLWRKRFDNIYEDAENFIVDKNERILKIGENLKKDKFINGQYIGLMKFNKKIWNKIETLLSKLSKEEIRTMDMTTFFSYLINNNLKLTGVPINGSWVEIDNKKDISIYKKMLKNKNWSHKWF